MATLLSNPFDLVATRIMAGKRVAGADMTMLNVIKDLWINEGILGFYKGFGPNMLRIGSFNIVMWLSYEQVKKLAL